MKTVFLTIFHGHIARNFLLTPILSLLKELKDTKVVLIVPESKKEYYEKQFGGGNIVLEGVPTLQPTRLDSFMRSLYFFCVDTETVQHIQGEQFLLKKKYLRYWVTRFLTKIGGNSRAVRNLLRWADRTFVKPQGFSELFDKYKPDLVFISSITSDQDSMVLREADRRGVKTLGMVRSWDNFSVNKGNVRIYPEKLLVHNRFLADDAIKLADFPPESIVMVGMPHFDFYVNEQRLSREETFHAVNADPSKRLLFFLMIGLSSSNLDKYVIGKLEELIDRDPEFKNFQLVVRPHPNTGKLIDTVGPKTLINYPKLVEFNARLTDREFTKEDMDIYAGLIAHSDVVISYQGTGTIDAAALDKPVINLAFEESPDVPYLAGIRHQYDYTHYRPIRATGGVRVVWKEEDMRGAILDYANNPARDAEFRKILVADQCYLLDGKASERVVGEIKKAL